MSARPGQRPQEQRQAQRQRCEEDEYRGEGFRGGLYHRDPRAGLIGEQFDQMISTQKGKTAKDDVERYLMTKNSDLRFYLYESTLLMPSGSGIGGVYTNIGKHFNEDLTLKANEMIDSIGVNIAFVPGYETAFHERINSIKEVNDKNASHIYEYPIFTEQDIAREMAKIMQRIAPFDW